MLTTPLGRIFIFFSFFPHLFNVVYCFLVLVVPQQRHKTAKCRIIIVAGPV